VSAATNHLDRAATIEAALDLLRSKFAERAAEHDRDGSFPHENFGVLHEFGLLSLTVPREAGGGGADLATSARVVRAIAYAEPATALVVIMQYLFHIGITQSPHWPERIREIVQRDAVENGALIMRCAWSRSWARPQEEACRRHSPAAFLEAGVSRVTRSIRREFRC
jgi:alkylation response protein AidB-like acyl-CoA dehydrogenase